MFAIEEDLDKKLWLYAIHLGKDRSEVVNDLLRPIVASMVLYDSRDRRSGRSIEAAPERGLEADGDTACLIANPQNSPLRHSAQPGYPLKAHRAK